MTETQIKATLKGAAYALVALVGWQTAVRYIQGIAQGIEDEQWSGPGNR